MFNKAFILIIVCIVLFGVFYHLIVNRKIEKFQTTTADRTAAASAADPTAQTAEVQAAAAAAAEAAAVAETTAVDSQVSASGESNSIPVRYFADIDGDGDYDLLTTNITQYTEETVEGSLLVKLLKFNGDDGFIYIKQSKLNKNISLILMISEDKLREKQTLISTNKFTISITPIDPSGNCIIDFTKLSGSEIFTKNFQAVQSGLVYKLVLNFLDTGFSVKIAFGIENESLEEETIINAYNTDFENVDNGFIMIGKHKDEGVSIFKGYIGKIIITSNPIDFTPGVRPALTTNADRVTRAVDDPDVDLVEITDEDFDIRRGHDLRYTNSFLQQKNNDDGDTFRMPVINKSVRMWKFNSQQLRNQNKESGFTIHNILSKTITIYFVIQFEFLENPCEIISGPDFKVEISNRQLVLEVEGQQRILGISRNKPYLFALVVSDVDKNITLFLDMVSETLPYDKNSNISSVRIGGEVNSGTEFNHFLGNFYITQSTSTFLEICESSDLCNLVAQQCSVFENEAMCNMASNTSGNRCRYDVKCEGVDPSQNNYCSSKNTISDCNNDRNCSVNVAESSCIDGSDVFETAPGPGAEFPTPTTTTTTRDLSKRNCSFNPEGKTRESCIDRCSNQFRSAQLNEDCNPSVCRIICDQCTSPNCLWKSEESIQQAREPMVPVASRVKAYAGDKEVKLMWVAPFSISTIEKYTCVIEGGDLASEVRLDFPTDIKCSLCEHIIGNLKNDSLYNIYVISTNKEGDSLPSNIVSVVPKEGRVFPETSNNFNEQISQIDDSLQEFQRAVDTKDISKIAEVSTVEQNNEDYYDLLDLLVSDEKNRRIINDNIKFEIVS